MTIINTLYSRAVVIYRKQKYSKIVNNMINDFSDFGYSEHYVKKVIQKVKHKNNLWDVARDLRNSTVASTCKKYKKIYADIYRGAEYELLLAP